MPSTERLIKIIKKYPIFYDHEHPDFRDSIKKDQTWDQVAEEMQEHAHHLKRKWRNLKDTYSRYLRCDETEEPTTKNGRYRGWQWAKQMEFCRPHVKFVRRKRSIPNGIEEGDQSDTTIIIETIYDGDDTQSESTPADNDLQIKIDRRSKGQKDNEKKITAKRKRKLNDYESSSKTDQIMSYLKNRDRNNMDPLELIFLGYAKIVKKFSPRRQAVTKMRFAQVLMEEEMQQLEDRGDTGNISGIMQANNTSGNNSNISSSGNLQLNIESVINEELLKVQNNTNACNFSL